MKKKEILIVAIIIAVIAIGVVIFVVAGKKNAEPGQVSNMCDIVLEPSKTKIAPGEEITLNVMMKNIRNDIGIGSLYGKLEYDKSVFEQVVQESLVPADAWEEPLYNSLNEKEGTLITLTKTAENMTEDNLVFTVNMKVLDVVAAKTTTIKLTGISTSDGEQDILNDDASVTLTISK